MQHHSRYLGLPSFVEHSRNATFYDLKEEAWNKLQGWKEQLLSQVGREILIKVVVQALSTYSMSHFMLQKSFSRKLQGMFARFLWGQRNTERKLHCLSWYHMCLSKFQGGMGFKQLEFFNLALLTKQ